MSDTRMKEPVIWCFHGNRPAECPHCALSSNLRVYPDWMMLGAEGVLDLIESDFGQSGRDVRLEAIRCQLWEAYERGLRQPVETPDNLLALMYECRDVLALHDQHNDIYRRVWKWCQERQQEGTPEKTRESLPPEVLADALQNRVHEDTGVVRAGRSVKAGALPPGFFKCGFCHAEAPEGRHVCGDEYSRAAKRMKEPLGFGIPNLVEDARKLVAMGFSVEDAIQQIAGHCELRSEAIIALRDALNGG